MTSLSAPTLETDRLILRLPTADDTQAMMAFFESDRAAFYGGPFNTYEAWHRFSAYVGQWSLRGYGMYCAVLKETGETIGMAGPFHPPFREEPEMSWLLTDDRFEGKGLAAEACRAVLTDLFETKGWSDVVSYIDVENAPSRALALKLGARLDTSKETPIANCESYRHFPAGGSK